MKYVIRAFYPPEKAGRKAHYRTIGTLETREGDNPRIRIDTIPVGPGWNGWCNCYPDEGEEVKLTRTAVRSGVGDDDIPF